MSRPIESLGYRGLVHIALGAGLVVALGAVPPIPIGVLPVPITLQTLGVMLAGLLLGSRRATAAMLVVVALVAMGLPVLSGGRGGLAVLVGPTAGYLYGWLPGAFIIGWATAWARRGRSPAGRIAMRVAGCVLGGVLAIHACGVAWLALVTGLGWSKALFGTLLFVPGDVAKAVLAALVASRVDALIATDPR